MNISQRIRRLPGGQVAILGLVAVAVVAELLSVRSTLSARAAALDKWYSNQTIELLVLQPSVTDSLKQLSDSSYRSARANLQFFTIGANRLALGLRPIPFERVLEDQRHADSIAYAQLERRRVAIQTDIDSLRVQSLVASNVRKVRLFSLDAITVAIGVSFLSVLWIWFGGQQRTQGAPAEATVVTGSPTSAMGINWSRLAANPAMRLLGWLLVILLGIVVFRIGEEVVLAISSVP